MNHAPTSSVREGGHSHFQRPGFQSGVRFDLATGGLLALLTLFRFWYDAASRAAARRGVLLAVVTALRLGLLRQYAL